MERDKFGYIFLVVFASIAVLYFTYKTLKRYNKNFIKRLEDFERRVFIDRLQEFEHRMVDFTYSNVKGLKQIVSSKHQDHEKKKIRHKIQLINRRLAQLEDKGAAANNNASNSKMLSRLFHRSATAQQSYMDIDPEKEVRFDARRVFDALDEDSKGELTFNELNLILGLDELELSEFVRRINELAKEPRDKNTVTRPVFVKYFLQILEETSNLTVSFEEAGDLFDEMADDGKTQLQEIHMSKFYNSSMSNFLSDLQICDLIKVRRFKIQMDFKWLFLDVCGS